MGNSQPGSPNLSNYKALLELYEGLPGQLKWHFKDLPKVLKNDIPLEIPLAYIFLKIESAWNRALYLGLVRVHKADHTMARRILDKQHLTRDGFQNLFKNVFGSEPQGELSAAEKIRDRVIHGKNVSAADLRQAIWSGLSYSLALHHQVVEAAGFTPFGDMRGALSKIEFLNSRTSKWLLKGLGFHLKA